MRWTLREHTSTPEVAPVWLGTFVWPWVEVVLLERRHLEGGLSDGIGLADDVVRQWSARQQGEPGPRMRTHQRLALTIWLTRHWSADELLAFDAEHAFFIHGVSGMRAGAQVLLGREWEQLDAADLALLLAVKGSRSGQRDPWCHPDRIRAKRDWILLRLRDLGGLAPEEAEAALQVPVGLALRPPEWPPCPVPPKP